MDHAAPLQPVEPLRITVGYGFTPCDPLDPRDDTIAVGHENGFAPLHLAQVIAEALSELGDLYYLHRCALWLNRPLREIPVEDVRAVPGHHALAAQDRLERPLDVADPVRDAGEIR